MVKVIALQRISKTQPGGELELRDNLAHALVRLGKARYVDEAAQAEAGAKTARPAPRAPRRRREPVGAIGAVTRAEAGTQTE